MRVFLLIFLSFIVILSCSVSAMDVDMIDRIESEIVPSEENLSEDEMCKQIVIDLDIISDTSEKCLMQVAKIKELIFYISVRDSAPHVKGILREKSLLESKEQIMKLNTLLEAQEQLIQKLKKEKQELLNSVQLSSNEASSSKISVQSLLN